jgi:hypothetical protein
MSNVKKYTDEELLKRAESLPSFKGFPQTYWVCAVRSNEDETDSFDDKIYIFRGQKFVCVTSGTTNKGNKGTGVVCADVWNYGVWKFGKHKGRANAGVQIKGIAYQRDFTEDGKINATTEVKTDIRGFNFHGASHDLSQKVVKKNIGGWSEGCIVCNDIPKFAQIINYFKEQSVFSMVILNEF